MVYKVPTKKVLHRDTDDGRRDKVYFYEKRYEINVEFDRANPSTETTTDVYYILMLVVVGRMEQAIKIYPTKHYRRPS